MIELLTSGLFVILIIATLLLRFGVLRRSFRAVGWSVFAACLLGAFLFPLACGVWLPDMFFAPHRTLARAVDQRGQTLQIVQYWNRIDFYSTELQVASPGTPTQVITIDGDDKKRWSASLAIDEASRAATVSFSDGRTQRVEW